MWIWTLIFEFGLLNHSTQAGKGEIWQHSILLVVVDFRNEMFAEPLKG